MSLNNDQLYFEIQRRGFQWSKNSTLDDTISSMLFDADPNTAVPSHSDGEDKLISMLIGSTFMQSAGVLWLKTIMPNTWISISGGSSLTQLDGGAAASIYLISQVLDGGGA